LIVFVYDGSVVGFLNIVYKVYNDKIFPQIITKTYTSQMFDEVYEIKSDEDIAKRVYDGLQMKFHQIFLEKIKHIFLCDSIGYELEMLKYIISGFKEQKNLLDLSNQNVYYIDSLEKELFKMAHKFKGFIRFMELEDGIMYSTISPKYNILPIIKNHFITRFKKSDFIIYDDVRKIALCYINEIPQILDIVNMDIPKLSNEESKYQNLWKKFFNQVGIKERENKKLQQSFVPLWYQKQMLEFN
jgi:probable DNA metabolism protein